MHPTPRDLAGIVLKVAAIYFFPLLYYIAVMEITVHTQKVPRILLIYSAEIPWVADNEHIKRIQFAGYTSKLKGKCNNNRKLRGGDKQGTEPL